MPSHMMLIGAAFAAISSGAANAEDGKYSAQLVQMLTATAAGKCSPEIMGDALLTACNTQLPTLSAGLAQMGKIDTVTFAGTQDTDKGPVEIYKIKYASGQAITWVIGQFANGKFNALFTNGN